MVIINPLVRTVSLKRKHKRTEEEKEKAKKMIAKLRKEEEQPVTGVFRSIENKGDDVTFPYRRFEGPIDVYHFKDGQEATIPLGVARHINNDCKYPVYDHLLDSKGNKLVQTAIGGWRQRFQFISKDFM